MNTLPKAIPLDMLQLQRMHGGGLQMTAQTPTDSPKENSEAHTKIDFSEILELLQDSGKPCLVITNKHKATNKDTYFELTLQKSGIQLLQISESNKLNTTYSFETNELKRDGISSHFNEDFDKFAITIKHISDLLAENKADIIGKDHG